MSHSSSEAVSSSSSSINRKPTSSSLTSTSSSNVVAGQQRQRRVVAAAVEDPSVALRDGVGGGGGGGGEQESVTVERRCDYSAVSKWTVQNFPKLTAKILWSKYFAVGGYDCRLLVYPKGDSQALPGYVSIYLNIMDPSSAKWDCFASYRLAIVNQLDDSKTIVRDSWHRFTHKKKSHGWCDFTHSSSIFDFKAGYLFNTDSILVTADILILNESVNFSCDNNEVQSSSSSSTISQSGVSGKATDVLSGKFTWKVHNFSLFKEMIKTQKIMSPVFPAGMCNLRISVYQSSVNGVEYLSMCLESKDTEKTADRSCWCLFRMSVLNQKQGLNHMHRDSYGRFAADNKTGDNTSLGWNDYMKMSDFIGSESGFLVDDTAVFSTSFHVIKEHIMFSKNAGSAGTRSSSAMRKSDGHSGKFTWRIENFTRLKDLLKKRKITGLCIKSRRFQIGNQDCRLIIYPRGQSQPPCHLSVFLEVTDSRNTSSDWSCFVSHRLSVVNQRQDDKSVTKESQNRYSKAAKDWGWREFVTLTSLFDQDSGFLLQDTVSFSAEVLILKEASTLQVFCDPDRDINNAGSQIDGAGKQCSFTWRVENFLAFKEIMETRKIFSKFFQAGGCELRIGVYESFDTICIYLESDQSAGSDPDNNFWVKYRMAIQNHRNPAKTVWKESSICTKTWNNSVLQFMKVSDMLEVDAGFLARGTVAFVCEILDCCPWFEFSDLEVLASEDDQDALTTDPDELIDSEDSEVISGDEEDIFRNLLSRAGFHLTFGDNPSQPQVTLREKLLMDAGAIAVFLTGLRVYLDDPVKVKRLLLPTKISGNNDGKKGPKSDESSPSLMNLLMGVKVLQQAIVDLLLDIMVECCQPSEVSSSGESSDAKSKPSLDCTEATNPLEADRENGASASACEQHPVHERLDSGVDETTSTSGIHSSGMSRLKTSGKAVCGQTICPPQTSAGTSFENVPLRSKTKWPEQSEELLGLIVNSLRALDGSVSQGCPEPRRKPQSAQKIALILDKAPKHLQPDLVALVPKLVEHSEHPLAACVLLDRLQNSDAEPSLRVPVLGVLSQLECGQEMWERALYQSLELITELNDEPLAATLDFIFNAASQCQHLHEAVQSVRVRLKGLGTGVSSSALDVLCKTVNYWGDVADTILREIDLDDDFSDKCSDDPSEQFLFGGNMLEESACRHFSDIYLLVEMLSIPCLAIEACQVFERAVTRGIFVAQSVAMVMERRLAQRLNNNSQFASSCTQQTNVATEGIPAETIRLQQDDFTSILGLAEALTLSRDPRVRGFVKMLYTILFKWYADDTSRERMLKRLVDRSMIATDSNRELDLDMDILSILVSEEQELVRPVLCLMREVAELTNVDRAALWHQLCVSEDEIIRIREEKKLESSNMAKEKAAISQRLTESENVNKRLKLEMKAETDCITRERKENAEQLQEAESQLEWLRSERDEEIAKLTADKRALHDRLHEVEAQLSQLKSRNRDELKRVAKEKNALAERLKSAEASRKKSDEEVKRYSAESNTGEEMRKSLEDELRLLKETVGKTEEEKREKEELIVQCQTYIAGLESKLQEYQLYVHNLKGSLQEEMSKHAPLYGAGLDALSMKELETLSRIHEEGLRQIHTIQHQKRSPAVSPLVSPHSHGFYSTTPQIAVGLPSPLVQNGGGIHGNGHLNGAVGPWFNHN